MSSLEFDLNTLQTIPLFNNIINSLHDGVLIADQEGYVKYVNTAYLRLTGVTSRDVLDKRIEEVRRGARLPEVLKTGKALLGIRRKVGNIEYIADISPILLNNKVVGAISIVRDITEITELSSKLKDYTHKVQELHNKVREIHQAHYDFGDIIGKSREIEKVKGMALRVAAGDAPVLILGESGSGKELFAHAIHKASPRSKQPLRRDQLLGLPASPAVERTLRLRGGGLHGRGQGGQAGPLRAGPRRDALSRRDRRHGVRPPGQAAENPRDGRVHADRRDEAHQGGRPDRFRHEQGPGKADPRNEVPRGSVLSPQRDRHPDPPAEDAPGGHPRAGRISPGQAGRQDEQEIYRLGGGPRHTQSISLPRECPGAFQHPGICGKHLRDADDPAERSSDLLENQVPAGAPGGPFRHPQDVGERGHHGGPEEFRHIRGGQAQGPPGTSASPWRRSTTRSGSTTSERERSGRLPRRRTSTLTPTLS